MVTHPRLADLPNARSRVLTEGRHKGTALDDLDDATLLAVCNYYANRDYTLNAAAWLVYAARVLQAAGAFAATPAELQRMAAGDGDLAAAARWLVGER